MHTGGNEEGSLKWIETGNKGDKWIQARVSIKHEEAFWVSVKLLISKQPFFDTMTVTNETACMRMTRNGFLYLKN